MPEDLRTRFPRNALLCGALTVLAAGPVAFAQGTAEAVIAEIPGANIISSVTLSTPGGSGAPGQSLEIPFNLALAGTAAPASFQIDLSFDPAKLTFVSARVGPQLAGASKGLSSTVVASGDVRLSTTGANQNGISAGLVAYASFTMASPFGAASTPVTLVNCMSSGTSGSPLSTGCTAGTIAVLTCDVNRSGTVGVADVQTMIDEALGVSPAVHDLNRDGAISVADIQIVIDAAMGQGCVF